MAHPGLRVATITVSDSLPVVDDVGGLRLRERLEAAGSVLAIRN